MKPADFDALTNFLIPRGVSFEDLERVRIALTPGAVVVSPEAIARWRDGKGHLFEQPHQGDPALLALILPLST